LIKSSVDRSHEPVMGLPSRRWAHVLKAQTLVAGVWYASIERSLPTARPTPSLHSCGVYPSGGWGRCHPPRRTMSQDAQAPKTGWGSHCLLAPLSRGGAIGSRFCCCSFEQINKADHFGRSPSDGNGQIWTAIGRRGVWAGKSPRQMWVQKIWSLNQRSGGQWTTEP